MKRRWMYITLSVFFAFFLLYSCTPPTTNNGSNNETTNNEATNSEVTIVIDRMGVNRNATLVLAQDGLNGEWKELTGTDGVYTFTVNDEHGIYSVAAVDRIPQSDSSDVKLFHGTLAEAKMINILFNAYEDTDYATLTINVPTGYATTTISVFFLKDNSRINSIDNGKASVKIPKGKGELVVFISDPETYEPLKVYIKRGFDFQGDGSITINENELKSPEKITDWGDEVKYGWVLGKTIIPSHINENIGIPTELMQNGDRYVAGYRNWAGNLSIGWSKVTENPTSVTVKEGVKALEPATTTISATGVEGDLPKITFSPYQSEISDYEVKYYGFYIYSDYITITPGYLAKVNNAYTFPKINSDNWEPSYNPPSNYTMDLIAICLSLSTIDEINSLKVGSEWVVFDTWLRGV